MVFEPFMENRGCPLSVALQFSFASRFGLKLHETIKQKLKNSERKQFIVVIYFWTCMATMSEGIRFKERFFIPLDSLLFMTCANLSIKNDSFMNIA